MSEIFSREQKPAPGIDYSEIHIPDKKSLGTGIFTMVIEPDAMVKNNPIVSSIVNVPVFQLMVNINSEEKEVVALIGRADNTPALSRKAFELPGIKDLSRSRRFEVVFKDWNIKDLLLNGKKLQESVL